MDAILSAASKPPLLRAGIQPAIAAGENDHQASVELELIGILEGPSFRGSSRSAAFLRFVVEETLAGRQEMLKERTIGAVVLGKAPGYDTGADSGVRVRANEVRKKVWHLITMRRRPKRAFASNCPRNLCAAFRSRYACHTAGHSDTNREARAAADAAMATGRALPVRRISGANRHSRRCGIERFLFAVLEPCPGGTNRDFDCSGCRWLRHFAGVGGRGHAVRGIGRRFSGAGPHRRCQEFRPRRARV